MALDFLRNLVDSRHIVIVDDDPNIRRIFSDLLRKRKYEVTVAASWDDLRKQVLNQGILKSLADPNLYLLDCFLKPPPPGPEIAVMLRQEGYNGPICFITAMNCSLDEERKLTSITSKSYLLQKPVSPKALLAKVAELAK